MSLELNASQRAAVERWGQDVCVVAGPGSGKTRVLIERFRWLVEAKGISPRRILAVTFTDKAATEIKKRLILAFADSDELREEIERAWVSTIHGFCTRLLKENAIAARLDPDFRLMEEAQSQMVRHRIAEAALDGLLRREPAATRMLLSQLDTGGAEIAQGLMDLYEELRTAGVAVSAVRLPRQGQDTGWGAIGQAARVILMDPVNGTANQREAHQKAHLWARDILSVSGDGDLKELVALLDRAPRPASLSSKARARAEAQELRDHLIPATLAAEMLRARIDLYPLCLEALTALHREYEAWKRERGLIDFNDLEEHAIALLESGDALREGVQNSFDQVLMDELQDTNRLQWRLIDLVRRPDRLFAVGDINQSIYYFRHADPGVFRAYRDSLAAAGKVIDELRENYRSRAPLLAAVNAVTPYLMDGVEPHTLVAKREYPEEAQASIEFTHTFAAEEDDAARTEALWIARRVREMESAGKARFSDIAILARTIAALGPVQRALDEFGVPGIVTGGRSFYESREVRDLMSWLAVVANPLDEINLVTLLRSPLVGMGDEDLLRLKIASPRLVDALAADPPQWFVMLQRHRAQADMVSPDRFLAEILDASGYEEGLPARARANIAKLLGMLRERWWREPVPVSEIVDELAVWRDSQTEAEAAADEVSNCVRLMSVHAAKGLEFPVVFLAAMRSGGQNRKPVFCFDAQHTLGASWRHPVAKGGIPDPVHLAVSAAKKKQEDGEEDRLLYVAMTRAEEHLVFTASPGGQGSWAKRVSEGLGLPVGNPKAARRDTVQFRGGVVELLHTSEAVSEAGLPALSVEESEATEMVERPPWPDQHEATLPVTSVAQFAFCPRQYYLSRYLRWPGAAAAQPLSEDAPDRSEWTASDFGTMVHELLAGVERPDAPAEAIAMRRSFEESVLGRRAAEAVRVEREYDFLIEIEGAILRGQIDLWFEHGGELILVDYKTDQVEAGEEQRHGRRYVPQLRLYALAMQKLTGRVPARAVLWYLRTGTAVSVGLTQEDLEMARRAIRELLAAQTEMRFPAREGKHCLRCSYYHNACPAVVPEESSMGAGVGPMREV